MLPQTCTRSSRSRSARIIYLLVLSESASAASVKSPDDPLRSHAAPADFELCAERHDRPDTSLAWRRRRHDSAGPYYLVAELSGGNRRFENTSRTAQSPRA